MLNDSTNECSVCHGETDNLYETLAYDGENIQLCELCWSSPLSFLMIYKNHLFTSEDVLRTIAMSHHLILKKLEELNVNAQRSENLAAPQQLGDVCNINQDDRAGPNQT